MKKILFSLFCLLLVCLLAVSCDDKKEPDNEIKAPDRQTTKLPQAYEDDPDNGYGDIVIPQN